MLRFRNTLYVATAGVLLLTLLAPAAAGSLKTDLAVYVERLRGMYPETEITGRFHDWRSVSQYRSHAGLHLGYDIALNAGRAVPAGWPGRVTAIIPWTATEYGVQVQLANGYFVTYGHITPAVSEGQGISAGTTVGHICRDHVDIKVRSASGGYFDWGLSYGVLDGGAWSTGVGLLPPPPYEGGALPVLRGSGSENLLERYRESRTKEEACRAERDRTRDAVALLSGYIDQENKGLPEAEAHVLAYYRAADRNQITEAQAEAQSLLIKGRRAKVNRLIYVLEEQRRVLRDLESAFQSASTRSTAVRKELESRGTDNETLRKIDAQAVAQAPRAPAGEPNPDLVRRTDEARRQADRARQRYQAGGLAQAAMDEAVRNYERMRLAQTLWEQGHKDAARSLNF